MVIRLLVRALLQPSAPDPSVRLGSAGISIASALLEHASIGTSAQWRSLFLALARGGGKPWRDACRRLYDYSCAVGNSDPSIPVRLLLERFATATSDESVRAAAASPFDPVELVLQVNGLVVKLCILAQDDSADAKLVEQHRVLIDHIVRQLAVDLVSKTPGDRVSLVEDVLRMEGFDYA